MKEERLSEDVRKYYLLRYAVIGIILLVSGVFLGGSLGFWREEEIGAAKEEDQAPFAQKVEEFDTTPPITAPPINTTPPDTTPLVTTAYATITERAEVSTYSAVPTSTGINSLWLIGSIILLIFGISYATYTRISIPGFVRGYVEDQVPFWPITRKFQDFIITMDGTALRIRFSPKVRRGKSALRIELPLTPSLPGEQVRKICEQNGMRFSEAENLVYMIVTPEELNLKLLIFSRVVRQINALKQTSGVAM
ncbi:MAG: hypothetical protein ACFFCW_47505 [Candidatus Hodarchaeota archaeon]